jgi:hypothetical protein
LQEVPDQAPLFEFLFCERRMRGIRWFLWDREAAAHFLSAAVFFTRIL